MQNHLPSQAFRIAIIVAGCSISCAFDLVGTDSTAPTTALAAVATQPPSAQRGRRLFIQSCAHCHGDDAHGSGEDADGPDLYALRISNVRIAAVIRTGIPEEMPSFAKKHGATDIADLTAYLRTLR